VSSSRRYTAAATTAASRHDSLLLTPFPLSLSLSWEHQGFGRDGSKSPGARVYATTDGKNFTLMHHDTLDGS